ncbi:MAG: hypothetical protein HYY30_14525, partial [Chloroflexi bacterium]|nr:hypothetical protein [Chloroflexota bacterium]
MTVERLAQLIQVEPARYSVRFWLALLGLVFFLLVAFSSVSDRASGHEWGIAVQREGEGLRVVWVQPSGVASDAGVRPGDFVIAIDGLPSAVVEPSKIDEATTVTTADEQSTNISTMSAYGGMGTVLALGLLAAGVVFMVIGTSVLLWAPNVEEALAFYAFSSVSAVIYVLALSAYSGHLWNVRLQFIMTTLSFTCLAYLFLVFPKNRIRGLAPKSYIALFTPAIALITLFLIASLGWHSIYGAVRPLAYASDILWVLVAAIAFLWSFIELRREGAAGRLMAPIIGTAFAAIGIVFTTVLPLGLAREPLIPPETSALFGVLIPASFAYAILRHRLLGLSGIIRRAMISSFVGVALLASFVALSFAANRTLDVDPSNDALDLGLQILFLAIALVILPALQRLMQDFVDRVFFREVYQHDKALRN